jgi:vancomycin resistance protein YoaR
MKKTISIIFLVVALVDFHYASAQTSTANLPKPRGFAYNVKTFTLTFGGQKFNVDPQTISDWRGETNWYGNSTITRQPVDAMVSLKAFFGLPAEQPALKPAVYHYQVDKIYDYLKSAVATNTDQSLVEPSLTVENNRATNFTPPQSGRKLDVYKSAFDVLASLEENRESSELTVNETHPAKNLADTNTLGIKELVAEGTSNFKGSPKNRRFNIAVGVEKMKGILVAPGDTFSFDYNLGPVDGEHGFLPELVIKSNDTIPEFGGGLCQVSTTTFRAAMHAGLPIVERRNHAYPVVYYSPQGTDATIYPGSVDLKFINDTPGTILIWPYEKDKDNLVFDFYGTKDARRVALDNPVVYDRQPDGSMKATWTRRVTNNGQTVTKTFKSVYQSPSLFHHDNQFVSATGTPESTAPHPTKVQ